MSRKRLTQIFPFCFLSVNGKGKKFFLKMLLDEYRYAQRKSEKILPNLVFETSIPILNGNRQGFRQKNGKKTVYQLVSNRLSAS